MRSLCVLSLACLVFVAGCGGPSVRVGPSGQFSAGGSVVLPLRAPDNEPSFCVATIEGQWGPMLQTMAVGALRGRARLRSLRLLAPGDEPGEGCDVLLALREKGISTLGDCSIQAHSAYTNELLWEGAASGNLNVTGFEKLAPHLQAAFQPGLPAFQKLMAGKPSKPPPVIESPPPGQERPEAGAAVAVNTDIDELPAARPERKSHAVVIGIERYRERLPNADFSSGDARLAAEYFKRVLGVPEANLALLTDERATKSDFEKYFERWLPNRVEAGDEVFVYFSGHGAPNAKTGDAYLVPYDADPTYIEQTGYPLKRMCEQLGKLPAKRVLVAMDSCFSGAGGRSVIAKGARPLVSVVQNEVPANITLIAASAGDQISNSYQEKNHGLFTYFFLKGLKEKGSDMKAVYDYLKPEVSRVARREYNSDQDPQWRQGK